MSGEGFILTIEACPYAFSTDGITGITPVHPEWAPSWTLIDGVLQNPSDYVSWNERILPIEGNLEVDSVTFKMFDKRVENIVWYTPQHLQTGLAVGRFSGNILTELFARGTPRQNENYLQLTLVSASLTSGEIIQELLLIEPAHDSLSGLAPFSPTGITGSLAFPDPTDISFPGIYPVWVDDEVVNVVGVSSNIAQIGTSLGVEDEAGRGLFGSRRRYHVVRPDFKPEVFLRHPVVVKRAVTLWRVTDSNDVSESSVFPIWRGFVQSNPQTSDDGVMFFLACNHKWQVYQNEPITFEGFDREFAIRRNVYTPIATQVIYWQNNSIGPTTLRADLTHYANSQILDPTRKFFSNPTQSLVYRSYNRNATRLAIIERIGYYAVGDRPHLNAMPSGTVPDKWTLYYQSDEPDPGQMRIGVNICGVDTWGNIVTDPDNNQRYRSAVYDFEIPELAVDYIPGDSNNIWPMASTDRRDRTLPTRYFEIVRGPSRLQTTISSVYIAEDTEAERMIYFLPLVGQGPALRNNGLVQGNILHRQKNGSASPDTAGAIQFLKKAYQLKSRLLLRAGPNVTTAEALLNTFFNSSNAVNLFNSVQPADFDLTNRTVLADWVSGIDNRGVELLIGPEIKFGEYLREYMKFFGYVFAIKNSKIRLVPYDLDADYSHVLTTSDLLEPPTLKQLPENIYNGLKITAPNFETEFTFTDAQSKGRYKTGNVQEFKIPNNIFGFRSPQAFAEYLTRFAKRFFSVWAYPQYLVKLKTSLARINIDIGDVIRLSDFVTPNFSFTDPKRGLSNVNALVIEKNVDLTTGIVEFSMVYQEKSETAGYSPCIRVEDVTLDAPSAGFSTITARTNFIKPINKFEPTGPTTFSSSDETSDYGSSNRSSFQTRYGYAGEDGGVSAFAKDYAVEFVARDSILGGVFHAGAKVTSVNPATRTIVIDTLVAAPLVAYIASGRIVDLRFTDYDNVSTQDIQKTDWAWIGDTERESLDNPPATAPTPRVTPASQFAV